MTQGWHSPEHADQRVAQCPQDATPHVYSVMGTVIDLGIQPGTRESGGRIGSTFTPASCAAVRASRNVPFLIVSALIVSA